MYLLRLISRRKCQATAVALPILFCLFCIFVYVSINSTVIPIEENDDVEVELDPSNQMPWDNYKGKELSIIEPLESLNTFMPIPPEFVKQLYYQSSLKSNSPLGIKKFLTIGISTVYREEEYLKITLRSLISQSSPEERKIATIVIYLADTDPERKELQLNLIQSNFKEYLDNGFVQLITSTPVIYPPFDFALRKRTFNDSVDRVIWRSKQVIDFAFLSSYVHKHGMSEYFLLSEDDVIASEQYITAVKMFVELKKRQRMKWTAMHFTTFLGIGLTFRIRDLDKLVQFLLLFYQDQPVDMLIQKFIMIQNSDSLEEGVSVRYPSIFQHIGFKSTLPNKHQKYKDSTFNIAKRLINNRNPIPLKITTTMQVLGDFVPMNAYSHIRGWFVGIPQRELESFTIRYNNSINISRIAVFSGFLKPGLHESIIHRLKMNPENVTSPNYLIKNAELQISPQEGNNRRCSNFTSVGTFNEFGFVDVYFNNSDVENNQSVMFVKCIRILIRPALLKSPLVIRELEIIK